MIPSNRISIQFSGILENSFRNTLTHLNFENVNVITIPVQNNIAPIAAVCGLSIPRNLFFDKNTVFAVFLINNNIMRSFNMREWNFIIAHECGHILYNHALLSLIVKAPEIYSKIISIVEKNPIYQQAYELIKFLIPLLIDNKITTIDKELIRKTEFEADHFAVRYTGDLETAENVLKRITNGNIDVPTHFFEYGDKKIPALTVEERINNIKRNLSKSNYFHLPNTFKRQN